MSGLQLKLRQKLLLLLFTVGFTGMGAFALIIVLADFQVFDRFVPENRALRDVEARSALLVQSYYRYMLTPALINTEVLDADLVLIRQSLERYRDFIGVQPRKLAFADDIAGALETLERSGGEMIVARRRFEEAERLQRRLESEITRVFGRDRYHEPPARGLAGTVARGPRDQSADGFSAERTVP